MQLCRERSRAGAQPRARRAPRRARFRRRRASISRSCHRARPPHRSADLRRRPGSVVALGERDCSVQRRNQKVIEETPAPGLAAKRARGLIDARRAAGRVGRTTAPPAPWNSSTTTTPAQFYFLEVNTGFQVEHGVTEEVTGIDLVEWMIRHAAGETASISIAAPAPRRVDPGPRSTPKTRRTTFRPSPACSRARRSRAEARVETWVEDRDADHSLLRPDARQDHRPRHRSRRRRRQRCARALERHRARRHRDQLEYLRQISPQRRVRGRRNHHPLPGRTFASRRERIDVLDAGHANHRPGLSRPHGILGRRGAALRTHGFAVLSPGEPRRRQSARARPASRSTMSGPTLKFNADADHLPDRRSDDAPRSTGTAVASGTPIAVAAGATLSVGAATQRRLPRLSRRSRRLRRAAITSAAAHLHPGQVRRPRRPGPARRATCCTSVQQSASSRNPRAVPAESIPAIADDWELGVLYGPHGAPDFFTAGTSNLLLPPLGRFTTTPAAPACA